MPVIYEVEVIRSLLQHNTGDLREFKFRFLTADTRICSVMDEFFAKFQKLSSFTVDCSMADRGDKVKLTHARGCLDGRGVLFKVQRFSCRLKCS